MSKALVIVNQEFNPCKGRKLYAIAHTFYTVIAFTAYQYP
jgi:hypothetical protein